MATIEGTTYRKSTTDFHQACKRCGRVFYFSRNCNGLTVRCPWCKALH